MMTNYSRLLCLVLLINVSFLKAQIRLEQNALLTIADNTHVSCAAHVFNYGRISNSGILTLRYDWMNYGEYSSDDDTIQFIGEIDQQVYDIGDGFSTIILDGAGIHVISNLYLSNLLILNRGYVRPATGTQFRLGEYAVIHNASEVSHIKGQLICDGSGDKFYPVGTEENYLPAWLHRPNSNVISAGLEAFEPNPILVAQHGIARVLSEAYWEVSNSIGDISGTRISLPYDQFTDIEPEMLVVAELSAEGSIFRSIGRGAIDEMPAFITSRDEISGHIFTIAEEDGLITICNIISPNGDAINDNLFITNIEEFPENKIMIFNRSGQLLYTEENYKNTWDGSIGGNPLPAGNYYCIVKLSDYMQSYSQTITIVR